MENTKILKCKCESQFQDETYGKGMRVHNIHQKEGKKASCTVCEGSARSAKRNSKDTIKSTARSSKSI